MGDVKLDVDDKNASDPPPDSQKLSSKTDVEGIFCFIKKLFTTKNTLL